MTKRITECRKANRWWEALTLFQELKEWARPDLILYSAVISACEKGGQVEEALRVFAELRQWHKPNVISYNASSRAPEGGAERWGWC